MFSPFDSPLLLTPSRGICGFAHPSNLCDRFTTQVQSFFIGSHVFFSHITMEVLAFKLLNFSRGLHASNLDYDSAGCGHVRVLAHREN